MAHSQDTAEAVDAPVTDVNSAAAAIANLNLAGDEPAEEQEAPVDNGESDELEPEIEVEEGEQDDEPAKPAIDAPASLNADEKAVFAQLPEEAQRVWAASESRRNGQVQEATTKASEAQRIAEARAAQADANAKAVYAQQLEAFATRIAPQRPDPTLAQTDPATFIALNAQYDAAKAQHDEFMQQVQQIAAAAETEMTQAEQVERGRQLLSLPEVQNPETREVFFQKAEGAAKRIGLDVSVVAQKASASEIKALRDIADAFEKADKYDTAMAKQMQRVREAKKTKATLPTAAQPVSGDRRAFQEATQRLKQSGSVEDAAAALRNIL